MEKLEKNEEVKVPHQVANQKIVRQRELMGQ